MTNLRSTEMTPPHRTPDAGIRKEIGILNTEEKKKRAVTYTDPRARRLIVNAYIALGAIGILTLMLASYMVTAGGAMNVVGYGVITLMLALAVGGSACLVIAPRVEARYAAAAAASAQLAAFEDSENTPDMEMATPPPPAFTPVAMPTPTPKPNPVAARTVPDPEPVVAPPAPVPAAVAPVAVQN